MSTAFEKVQGLGNDFVLLDARRHPALVSPQTARRLCDRRLGIGADGVLTLLPPRGPAAAWLHIYNADGSEAEMCGNGLRCAARLLLEERGATTVQVETAAGPRKCHLEGGEVRIEVGKAEVAPPEKVAVGGETVEGQAVSVGNPHFVIFGGADEERVRRLGPLLEHHPRFAPARTNVELCERTPGGLRVAVWERGSGLTLACGTGAAAAAAAAVQRGLLSAGKEWTVELPGGRLHVEVAAGSSVSLRGPAVRVYRGEIELGAEEPGPPPGRP
jgi:diaminopimelate epimerase